MTIVIGRIGRTLGQFDRRAGKGGKRAGLVDERAARNVGQALSPANLLTTHVSRAPLQAEALFRPGVAAHVIAVGFPETGAVLFHQLQAVEPLGALPGV